MRKYIFKTDSSISIEDMSILTELFPPFYVIAAVIAQMPLQHPKSGRIKSVHYLVLLDKCSQQETLNFHF